MALSWSPWYPLSGASRNQDIPRAPGLYRIRRADIPGLDYVGQTGVLRQRMGNLNNAYGDVMPYNAPHTAGPGFGRYVKTTMASSKYRWPKRPAAWRSARASSASLSRSTGSNTAVRRR